MAADSAFPNVDDYDMIQVPAGQVANPDWIRSRPQFKQVVNRYTAETESVGREEYYDSTEASEDGTEAYVYKVDDDGAGIIDSIDEGEAGW
jgi:hypothetical protein